MPIISRGLISTGGRGLMRSVHNGATKLPRVQQPQQRFESTLVFTLRREPLYHKLQYSKVPKFDAAAAALGVITGAFVVYLGLSSLGSAGADLTDLTTLCWYVGLWLTNLRCCSLLWRAPKVGARGCRGGAFWYEVGVAVKLEFKRMRR